MRSRTEIYSRRQARRKRFLAIRVTHHDTCRPTYTGHTRYAHKHAKSTDFARAMLGLKLSSQKQFAKIGSRVAYLHVNDHKLYQNTADARNWAKGCGRGRLSFDKFLKFASSIHDALKRCSVLLSVSRGKCCALVLCWFTEVAS